MATLLKMKASSLNKVLVLTAMEGRVPQIITPTEGRGRILTCFREGAGRLTTYTDKQQVPTALDAITMLIT
jgi:hypothetical protein